MAVAEERGPGAAFLLAQVGAAVAARFERAVDALDLTPAQAGLMRQLASGEPRSQQDLSRVLGTAPSRVVTHLDQLEDRGLVERRPGKDRRVNLVSLTPEGERLMRRLRGLARQHDAGVTSGLDEDQYRRLVELLRLVADDLGLTPGVHPGHRTDRG